MKYDIVPTDMLTNKDIDYLNDSFNYNFLALKQINNYIDITEDEDILNLFDKVINLFDDNLNITLNLLDSRGKDNE